MEKINSSSSISSCREIILLKKLQEYFNDSVNSTVLAGIINHSEPVSLRLIDWFVTNYSKHYSKQVYDDLKIDVHNNYKSQLKAYNKKLFDPFCRSSASEKDISKFNFYYDQQNENNYFVTTVGQLNFFKWAFELRIIEYIFSKVEEIKYDIKYKYKNSLFPTSKHRAIPVAEDCDLKAEINYSVSF